MIDRRKELVSGLSSLDSLLDTVCELLYWRHEENEDFSGNDLNKLIQDALQNASKNSLEVGQLQAAERNRHPGRRPMGEPYSPLGTVPSAQRGYYLVYLFAKDGSGVSLSLIKERKRKGRGGSPQASDGSSSISRPSDRPADGHRASIHKPSTEKVEAGSAYAIRYERGAFLPTTSSQLIYTECSPYSKPSRTPA